VVLPLSCSCGESRLPFSWCAGDRCGMACNNEDRDRSRRPGAEEWGWSHRSDTRWPGDRVTLCAVCTVHIETRSAGFLVEPQNQGRWFVSGLASKPLGQFGSGLASKPLATVFSGLASKLVATVSPVLASKSMVTVSWLGPPNQQLQFGDLSLKMTEVISWFGPQNQMDFGLSVAP
jgi:hypothetical protein